MQLQSAKGTTAPQMAVFYRASTALAPARFAWQIVQVQVSTNARRSVPRGKAGAIIRATSFLEKHTMIETRREHTGILRQENSSTLRNRAVMNWLFLFVFVVAFLVVFGGFVRLTRSGLSITEWNPISGTMPPLGESAWQDEFAKYQATPEFQQINSDMTLEEYQYIFYIEWIHRFIARFAGLVYAIPVFYFLFTKQIPFQESAGVHG
jgi:hypothetical protein